MRGARGSFYEYSPTGRKKYEYKKRTLGALELRSEINTGGVRVARNVDTAHYPLLKSARGGRLILDGFDGKILDVLCADEVVYILRHLDGGLTLDTVDTKACSILQSSRVAEQADVELSYTLVRFNEFLTPTDPIGGSYAKKLIVLPYFYETRIDGGEQPYVFEKRENVPFALTATVFMSRLFTADGGKLFASCFNSAGEYTFDSAEEMLASNAWMTNTQSNTKANGDVTALTVYDGHVIVFKKDYMMQIYNDQNPFRIVEIGPFGCLSSSSVCEFDGKLIFCGGEGLFVWGGGYPRSFGEELGLGVCEDVRLCSFGKKLFVGVKGSEETFVYDGENACWSSRVTGDVDAMCSDKNGAYYIIDGGIYEFDGGEYLDMSVSTDSRDLGSMGEKLLSKVSAQMILGDGAQTFVYLTGDDGKRSLVGSRKGPSRSSFECNLYKRCCDYVSLSFECKGEVSIGEICIEYKTEV